MSETNETDDKTSAPKMTLGVRRTVESGHVRQSFSHGRSKSVVVEKKKRRSIGSAPAAQPAVEPKAAEPVAKAPPKAPAAEAQPRRSGVVLRQLSEEEKDARAKALASSRVRDAYDREKAKETAAQ